MEYGEHVSAICLSDTKVSDPFELHQRRDQCLRPTKHMFDASLLAVDTHYCASEALIDPWSCCPLSCHMEGSSVTMNLLGFK